jgi:predicted ATP-grasp superfamily ATP-dependent carboligase
MTLPAVELSPFSESSPAVGEGTGAHVSSIIAHGQPGAIILGGAYGALAVARSLGRQGIPVWLVGADSALPRLSRYVRRVFAQPDDAAARLAQLKRLATDEGASGWVLFPASDAQLQFVARHSEELAHHFRLFTMDWELLVGLNDKAQLAELAAALGVPSARIHAGAALEDPSTLQYPVLIKPRANGRQNALTRAKAWRADAPSEFAERRSDAEALMGADGFLVQEMIPGGGDTQYSYAALWDRGHEVSSVVVRRLRQFPLDFGTSPYVEAIDEPAIGDPARRLLAAFDFHGLVEVDLKFDSRDGLYKPLDFNTRVWAWIGLTDATGHAFAWQAWRMALGFAPARPVAARGPKSWVLRSHAALSVLQQVLRGEGVDRTGWRALLGSSVGAVVAPDDPLPGLFEFPVMVGRLARRMARRR